MKLPTVASREELVNVIDEIGFLPFFENEIPGFSLEECVDPRFWFPDKGEGVWEWKGPVIQRSGCAYGKFFHGKAGFISRAWFPDFANLRRDGYDLDALYDDGYAKRSDLEMWKLLSEHGALQTGALKKLGGFSGKDGKKGFDGIMTRLQMQCYAVIGDFPYQRDRYGNIYGWGVAQYETPESRFGADFTRQAYQREPKESKERILRHLRDRFPGEDPKLLEKLLQGGVTKQL